jgi:chromosome segregation ATPase
MRRFQELTRFSFPLSLACLCLLGLTAIFADSRPPVAIATGDAASPQQIMAEVRKTQEMVRQAVKELYQSQRLLHELRFQHERLQTLQASLDQVRRELADAQADHQLAAEHVREAAQEMANEQDSAKLRVLKDDHAEQRQKMERYAAAQQQAEQRESQLLKESEAAKSDLAAAARRLDALERTLAPLK